MSSTTTTTAASPEMTAERNQKAMLASQRAESRRGRMFPLGFRDACGQWWASVSPDVAEHKVMSFIPYLQRGNGAPTQTATEPISPSSLTQTASQSVTTGTDVDPYGPRVWNSNMVRLSGKNRLLNEFSVERVGEEVEENLVMLHGYGAGLGLFYRNYEGISRVKGWKVYALDMLGMGRSSRPTFRIHAKNRAGQITESENWFIDALEEWRIQRKIEKFTLLGHSMGGYMATAYALKYPGHLKKLILASPVGVPEDPYAVAEGIPDPEESTMAAEFTQDQEAVVSGKASKHSKKGSKPLRPQFGNEETTEQRTIPRWVVHLWNSNISPFSFVRWTGPLGPQLTSGWSSRRFSHLPQEEAEALHSYAYSLFRQAGSGEYVLAYILAPGAFARSPLIRRIQGVGRQLLPPAANASATAPTKEHGYPVVFMYGDADWMDVKGGYAAEKKIKERREAALKTATDEERRLDNGSVKVLTIKNAGHNLFLDAWDEFNVVMRAELEETSRHSKAGLC